jgi:glycosyltransferase involved in cell wall biosynthesis
MSETRSLRAIRVLHVTSVEAENYYLNSLVDSADETVTFLVAATLAPPCGFSRALAERGVPVSALDCNRRLRYPRAFGALRRIVRSQRIDLLHAHLFEPSVLSALVAAVEGKVLVTTRHHSDAVHRIPNALRRHAYAALESWVNRRAVRIIAPSRAVQRVLLDREGVSPEKVVLIPYPQPLARYSSVTPELVAATRRALEMTSRLSLVCVSRLHPEKGHIYLFRAFRRLLDRGIDASLYLVGTGDLRNALEREAGQLGIGARVRFLGWRDDALAILASADVVVHPSLHEALPSAVIEATVMERPVVATDVSGVSDILDGGAFGTIVKPADDVAFFKGLLGVLRDLELARERARRGRIHVLEYMNPRRIAVAHARCYEAALGSFRERGPACRG